MKKNRRFWLFLVICLTVLFATGGYDPATFDGSLYIGGKTGIEGNYRISLNDQTGIPAVQIYQSGIWQPGSFEFGSTSVYIGDNMKIEAVGHNLASSAVDRDKYLYAHSSFDGTLSTEDTKVFCAFDSDIQLEFQPDYSGSWTGTDLGFSLTSADDGITQLIDNGYFKTHTTAATKPIRYRIYYGTDSTGTPFFDQTYPASLFPASSDIQLQGDGSMEFEPNKQFFHRWTSDETFSLKTESTGNIPYIASDVSYVREDSLIQTRPWIDGNTWSVGDTFIDSRKIYTCSVDGVQTGTFAENFEKWNEHGQWLRLGSSISYDAGHVEVGGGDIVITTGVIRSDGRNSMGDAFIAGLSAGASLTGGHGNTLIGYKAGNLITDETENTFIGMKAGEASTNVQHTTGIGAWCLQNAENITRGTAIGGWAGEDSSANDCVYLGYKAGFGETTPSKFWLTNNDGPLLEGSFADEWLHIYGELTMDQDLVIGEEGIYDGKITLEDSGSKSDHATLYTNSDGDLIMEAVANGAVIENVIDGFTGWFVVSDQNVSGLMTVKHTTGDMYVKGNVGIGGAGYPDRLAVRSLLNNGGLTPALRLINPYHTAGTATGLLFQCNSGTPGYARAGIFFEANGVGWGRGTMHFATKATSQTTDVDVSNSVMKIDEYGRVGINTGTDALVAKLEVNGDVHVSGDVHFKGSGKGLTFSSMYAKDNTTPLVLNSAAKVQVVAFDTNGFSNGNDTSNHGSDHITIGGGGHYLVTLSCHVNNNAAQTHKVDLSIWVNNGATEKNMLHGHRTLTGGSGDVGSMSISGVCHFADGDTVEVWADTSDAADRSVTFEDISLTLIRIAG